MVRRFLTIKNNTQLRKIAFFESSEWIIMGVAKLVRSILMKKKYFKNLPFEFRHLHDTLTEP